MTVLYEFRYDSEGDRIGIGDNTVLVSVDVVGSSGSIHIGKDGEVHPRDMVPITGNTYEAKETIKEANYGRTERGWNGEEWVCKAKAVGEIIAVLVDDGYVVTVGPDVVHSCEGLEEWHDEVQISDNETFRFEIPPLGEDNKVSQSWAEEAAELGNYDSAKEFCDNFDLEPVPDKELVEEIKEDNVDIGDKGKEEILSSSGAI